MENNNDNISTKTKKRGRTGTKVAIVLAVLLMASLAGAYWLLKDSDMAKSDLRTANKQISELQKENALLKIELDTTKTNLRRERDVRTRIEQENDTLKTMFPLYITDMQVGNADANGRIITPYGSKISASSSMYLMPRIKYVGLKPGLKVELMVRLYDNQGHLVTGNTSPAGYSFANKIDPIELNENILSLSGWGGGDKGHFERGTYRYEVWLGDRCLKQLSFRQCFPGFPRSSLQSSSYLCFRLRCRRFHPWS